jgi:hypothetical protein
MSNTANRANLEDLSSLVLAAQELLSAKFGKAIHIPSLNRLTDPDRRNAVYRCTAYSENELTGSFIIKKISGPAFSTRDPDDWDVTRFFNDWVGAEYLESVFMGSPIGPRFFGGNIDMGFFILEDLGEHRSLVGPLLEGDATGAEKALQKFAVCLGKLHASTAGDVNRFQALYTAKLAGLQPFLPERFELEARLQKIETQLENLGLPVPAALTDEIQRAVNAVVQPDEFLTYIHGDPCPDNLFDMGDHFRLIDFEFGHFGHALLDSVYPRMIFTTCWCANRIPEDVVARFEKRYREELVRGCPKAQEDAVWESALVQMCGYTLLRTLTMHLEDGLKEDHEWGRATTRQRVLARLQAFIITSEEFNKMPALRGTAEQLLKLLQLRWSETTALSLYPAFNQAA